MKPISTLLFLLPLTFCLALQPCFAAADKDKVTSLIEKACEDSAHKDLCVGSLGSHPDAIKQADLKGLAIIALKLSSSNATLITEHISKLLNETGLEPAIEQSLSDCLDLYLDAVDQLEDSVAALTAKGYHDVLTWVQAAIADLDSCDAAFKDQAADKLLLAHSNRLLRQLCNNVLAITKHLT